MGWRWVAVPVGLLVAVTLPAVVAQGDVADAVVLQLGTLGLLGSAALWIWDAFAGDPARSVGGKLAATVMVVGLGVATTWFFVAVGAAIATAGALVYGLVLLSASAGGGGRTRGGLLVATAVGVMADRGGRSVVGGRVLDRDAGVLDRDRTGDRVAGMAAAAPVARRGHA